MALGPRPEEYTVQREEPTFKVGRDGAGAEGMGDDVKGFVLIIEAL